MFKSYILRICVFFLIGMSSAPAEYLVVNAKKHSIGMFAMFSYVAGALYDYETHGHEGIEVDFGDLGFYYEPSHGNNWWEYYCEPIRLGKKLPSSSQINCLDNLSGYAYFTLEQLSRQQVNDLIQKYIKVKSHIRKKINQFVTAHFLGHKIITVHYRGTDKKSEAPRVAYKRVLKAIDNTIIQNQWNDYKIFVATDEQQFLDVMLNKYKDSVIYYSTIRSVNGKPVHTRRKNNYLLGEEAMIDCILLSRGDILIRTSSNLSQWSTYFNPNIPSILLNERYRRKKKCTN